MRTKRILSIIDLQKFYLDKIDNRVVNNLMAYVYSLLQLQKYDLIVNLSYDDYFGRDTDKRLAGILKTLRNVVYMYKDMNDGSEQILDAIHAKGIWNYNHKLEIVGINSDACVRDTICGLDSSQDYHANIFLHEKGVATSNGISYNDRAIREVVSKFNVKLIRG
jgi:hypothetical protein